MKQLKVEFEVELERGRNEKTETLAQQEDQKNGKQPENARTCRIASQGGGSSKHKKNQSATSSRLHGTLLVGSNSVAY